MAFCSSLYVVRFFGILEISGNYHSSIYRRIPPAIACAYRFTIWSTPLSVTSSASLSDKVPHSTEARITVGTPMVHTGHGMVRRLISSVPTPAPLPGVIASPENCMTRPSVSLDFADSASTAMIRFA